MKLHPILRYRGPLLAVGFLLTVALSATAESRRYLIYDGNQYETNKLAAAVRTPAAATPPKYLPSGEYWIPRSSDGHYYVQGFVNGHPVVFLIDTGATITAIPQKIARNAGIRVALEVGVETASGKNKAGLSEGNQLFIGAFTVNDAKVMIQEGLTTPLLGMDVLSRFTIAHNAGAMLLRPAR